MPDSYTFILLQRDSYINFTKVTGDSIASRCLVAEGVGFEPTSRKNEKRFSRPPP